MNIRNVHWILFLFQIFGKTRSSVCFSGNVFLLFCLMEHFNTTVIHFWIYWWNFSLYASPLPQLLTKFWRTLATSTLARITANHVDSKFFFLRRLSDNQLSRQCQNLSNRNPYFAVNTQTNRVARRQNGGAVTKERRCFVCFEEKKEMIFESVCRHLFYSYEIPVFFLLLIINCLHPFSTVKTFTENDDGK